MCGYSRRIIWLELVRSNNNPKIPGRLYLDAVKSLRGCPRLVRSDCGTENVLVAAMQCYFRASGDDEFAGLNAHKYGSSPSNQRIEGWHGLLSDEAGQTGGLIYLRICANQECLILEIPSIWNVYGFLFQNVSRKNLTK
jgi:hypothetical protein